MKQSAAKTPATHQGFLFYQRGRFAKITAALLFISLALYLFITPAGGHNGGTWLGYTLGGAALLIIFFLTAFGMRKRGVPAGQWSLQAWLSAHVWLGIGLIGFATLHTGFEFGLNVHTLAYAMMMLVIVSGFFGLYFYIVLPKRMTENRQQKTVPQLLAEITELDRQTTQQAMGLPDALAKAIAQSATQTKIGGSLRALLTVHPHHCATAAALIFLQKESANLAAAQQATLTNLLVLLQKKSDLLLRLRRDLRYKALLDLWLFFHIPLTIALLAALAAHILAVFYYW